MKLKLIDFGYKHKPLRAHANDAGADVYSTQTVEIPPNTTVAIPLGFGIELPVGYAGYVFPRSGLSAKGITCELPPIDSGYKGEWHAILTNNSTSPYMVHEGDRVGQILITPVVIAEFITENTKERGTNAFASTGK